MTVIAMTREMGSGGRDVAIALAEALDIRILHYQMVEQHLADQLKVDAGAVHRYLEGGDNVLSRWRLNRSGADQITAHEIASVALDGKVIIRGWGATQLLRTIAHVPTVRVCAPVDKRIQTLMRRLGNTDSATALKEIRASDAAHARTLRHYCDLDWRDPLLYDLVLNTERLSVADCVEQVLRLVELAQFRETKQSRRALSTLEQQYRLQARPNDAHGTVNGDGLRLHQEQPSLREDRDLFI